ncbi:MAG: SDR family oxidoreductase [bacterium]|nr:SDR family oxidoreductase [bacterium]
MKELDKKIALITGAAKGIGRGIAHEMAKSGATVVLCDIDDENLLKTEQEFINEGLSCVSKKSDVSSIEQNDALIDWVLEKYGKIDILVNNAGYYQDTSLLDGNFSDVQKLFLTNMIGPYFLTQRVAREMISQKLRGSILFTSSTHARVTIMRPAYSSSKAAIEMFVRETALELAEFGIRVNAVAPGAIDIWAMEDRKSDHVPVGHLGTPQDIGHAMVFLSSDKAVYITGQTLTVDGAFSLAHTHYWNKKGKL